MIQMPRRSVTRFFIPLIDVLILLFCIFLLMDFNNVTEVDKQTEIVEQQSTSIDGLQTLLDRRTRDLSRFEEDRPKLEEFDKMRKELEALQALSRQNLQDRTSIRIIDIDRHDGTISPYDESKAEKAKRIVSAKDAQDLIDEHKVKAQGKEVYYFFIRTRPTEEDRQAKKLSSGHPTKGEINRYKKLFSGVASNLGEYR